MVTWQRCKDLAEELIAAGEQLRFGPPLDPAQTTTDVSPVERNQLFEEMRRSVDRIEKGFVNDWPEQARVLWGRAALLPTLAEESQQPWRNLLAGNAPYWGALQKRIILEGLGQYNKLALLNLFIGPVQEFIVEARKVRDLWTGSYLLAAASFQAAVPLLRRFGPDIIVHPHLHESNFLRSWLQGRWPCEILPEPPPGADMPASVPNKLLAVVPLSMVETLGREAKQSLDGFWENLGDRVWNNFWAKNGLISAASWKDQLANQFHLYYTAVPFAVQDLDDYARLHRNSQEFFEERKLTRTFPYWPAGSTRGKCTLCNHREILGPEPLQEGRNLWRVLVDQGEGRFRPGERLCAVCSAKRLIQPEMLGVSRFTFDSTVSDSRNRLGVAYTLVVS